MIKMKQQETTIEARLTEVIANGERDTTNAVKEYEQHVSESTTQLAQSTEESSSNTAKMMTDFTSSVSAILAKTDKVYQDATASIESVAEVVDEHNLSVYEPTGESPAKRDRLDTSAILQVENDAEIRARYVSTPDTTMDESNQVKVPFHIKSQLCFRKWKKKMSPKSQWTSLPHQQRIDHLSEHWKVSTMLLEKAYREFPCSR